MVVHFKHTIIAHWTVMASIRLEFKIKKKKISHKKLQKKLLFFVMCVKLCHDLQAETKKFVKLNFTFHRFFTQTKKASEIQEYFNFTKFLATAACINRVRFRHHTSIFLTTYFYVRTFWTISNFTLWRSCSHCQIFWRNQMLQGSSRFWGCLNCINISRRQIIRGRNSSGFSPNCLPIWHQKWYEKNMIKCCQDNSFDGAIFT